MLKYISDKITYKLAKYTHGDEYRQTALLYGINMAAYTIFSTLGLLGVGWLLKAPFASMIIIAVYYFNQTVGGGFHANTHKKCFLTMTLFLVAGVLLCKLNIPESVLCIVGLFSLCCLFFHPVILHPKRRYLKDKLLVFVKRSRILVVFECTVLLVFFFFGVDICPYAMALLFSATSRIAAYFSKDTVSYSRKKSSK